MLAKYRISEEDYVNATKLYGKPTPKSIAVLLVLAVCLLLLALFGPPSLQSIAAGGIAGGLVMLILGSRVVSPMIARRHYRKYKAIQEEFAIEIQDDGIHLTTPNSNAKIQWAHILKWRHNDDYVLIFPMPRIYYCVPKTLVTQGFDMSMLLAQLTNHVGRPI